MYSVCTFPPHPFFFVPFIVFSLLFSLPPSRDSDSGSHTSRRLNNAVFCRVRTACDPTLDLWTGSSRGKRYKRFSFAFFFFSSFFLFLFPVICVFNQSVPMDSFSYLIFTGVHSNEDLVGLLGIGEYIVFYVDRRS